MSHSTLMLGSRAVGPGHPPLLIAEVAQAHDGSLGTAHAYIDAVADAGVDAVKFQTHIAAGESTLDEPFRVRFSRQDETRYGYWKRMEFTSDQWRGLADHASGRGLIFLSSAFSQAAVDLLASLDMPAWKVGSGEFRSETLIDAMIATGRPVLFSTGMSRWAEIEAVGSKLSRAGAPFALFQCTSEYPTPPEHVGLNVMGELRARFGCPVGLSDHSGNTVAAIAAMALGADLVEAHVTFDRRAFGPDVPASLTVDDFAELARARDALHVMHTNPVDKDRLADTLEGMRGLFSKSVAPARSLKAGDTLTEDLLVARKPGTGIPYGERHALVGRRLSRDVSPDRLLSWNDVS